MAKIQPTVPKGWQERLTFAGASIDADFGTYPSIGAALAAITIDRRAKGRQVAICDSSGKAMIYWWDTDDLTDNGLHLMENGLTSVSIYDVIGLQDALDAKADVDNVLNITPTEGQNMLLHSVALVVAESGRHKVPKAQSNVLSCLLVLEWGVNSELWASPKGGLFQGLRADSRP